MNKEAPIGIFDSGVGGLTVAREIMRQLPGEKLVYFGDTARVPYGNKSQENIIRYSKQILHFLETKEVKMIVIACNTASALALEEVREASSVPVIGVVIPGAKAAVAATHNNHIGVVGTEATIRSGMYEKVISQMKPEVTVSAMPCQLFVPIVEEGFSKHPIADQVIDYYLRPMKEFGVDSMILGCTHYPLLRTKIRDYMGDGIQIVNPAYETAMETKRILEEKELCNDEAAPTYEFYVSDAAKKFTQLANSILPYDVEKTRQISIEEY